MSSAEKIRVIKVEPEKKAYVTEIEPGLRSLQAQVCGYIQAVYPYEDPVAIICNEEGKLEGLPFCRAFRDEEGDIFDLLVGTFLIVGIGDDDFCSLSDELADKYLQMYLTPETCVRLGNKLVIIPAEE